jgi:hypothetical protein
LLIPICLKNGTNTNHEKNKIVPPGDQALLNHFHNNFNTGAYRREDQIVFKTGPEDSQYMIYNSPEAQKHSATLMANRK